MYQNEINILGESGFFHAVLTFIHSWWFTVCGGQLGSLKQKHDSKGLSAIPSSSSSHKLTFQQSLGNSCMIESISSAFFLVFFLFSLYCIVVCFSLWGSLLTGHWPLTFEATKMLCSPPLDSHTFTSLRPMFQSSQTSKLELCNFPALRLLSSFV